MGLSSDYLQLVFKVSYCIADYVNDDLFLPRVVDTYIVIVIL